MKVRRNIPPCAVPLGLRDIMRGVLESLYKRDRLVELQTEIKQFFGFSDVFLVSSGKAALCLILRALRGLNDRDEVLIPAYTCFSVPSAVIKAGLRVRLCDINVETLDFDFDMLEKLVGPRTLCVVPAHLFGIPADMERVSHICGKRNVFIVEDAAQAMGVRHCGKYLGTHGDVGFFSLGRGKSITCGSGGIIGTNSPEIAKALNGQFAQLKFPGFTDNIGTFFQLLFMSIFIHPALYWIPAAMPFLGIGRTVFYQDFPVKRLSVMQAGLLKGWQERLKWSNEIRMQTGAFLSGRLQGKVISREGVPYLRLPMLADDWESKQRLLKLSMDWGLGISGMYPSPVSQIAQLRDSFKEADVRGALQVVQRLVTLPTHHFLSEADKEALVRLVGAVTVLPTNKATESEVAKTE